MTIPMLFKSPVGAEGRFIRQAGEPGRYGHVLIIVEPSSAPGVSFSWEVLESQVPSLYKEAVYAGINSLFDVEGKFEQIECNDITVRVVGGSFHETDSSPLCYTKAASIAFEDAARRAGFVDK